MKQKLRLIFIGEEPSPTAIKKGWTWYDRRLASKTLHDALDASGFDIDRIFHNLFDEGQVRQKVLDHIKIPSRNFYIIALGNKVQRVLRKEKIKFTPMIHPAARGKIRKAENYAAHVKDCLTTIAQSIQSPEWRY